MKYSSFPWRGGAVLRALRAELRARVRQVAVALIGVLPIFAVHTWAQESKPPQRFTLDVRFEFLSLDDGPAGTPRADEVGLGVRSGFVVPGWGNRLQVVLHGSYFIPTLNNTPYISFVGVDLVGSVIKLSRSYDTPEVFTSIGIGAGNVHNLGATLELICGEGANILNGDCEGRSRFTGGWRTWMQLGLGVTLPSVWWLPRRVHGQLVIPVRRLVEDGQPPYLRLGVGWRVTG